MKTALPAGRSQPPSSPSCELVRSEVLTNWRARAHNGQASPCRDFDEFWLAAARSKRRNQWLQLSFQGMYETEQRRIGDEIVSLNIISLSVTLLCSDNRSVSQSCRVTFGGVISWFAASQRAKLKSVIADDARCKMAAVFWPPSEVAVLKRRLRAPHPPFREEILCCQPVTGFGVVKLHAPIAHCKDVDIMVFLRKCNKSFIPLQMVLHQMRSMN